MTCPREEELLDALARGFVGDELAAHAATCPICSELHSVAAALFGDRGVALSEASVPSAGAMWWRMVSRHRRDAATAARRWLLIGHAVTLLIAIALVLTFFGDALASIRVHPFLLVAVAMWMLAIPIAVRFLRSEG